MPTFTCHICGGPHSSLEHGQPPPFAPKPESTFCIDCGQPTTPGKGSARCAGCWQDRCQAYEEEPKELPVCLVCHGTDKYCGLCNGQSRRES